GHTAAAVIGADRIELTPDEYMPCAELEQRIRARSHPLGLPSRESPSRRNDRFDETRGATSSQAADRSAIRTTAGGIAGDEAGGLLLLLDPVQERLGRLTCHHPPKAAEQSSNATHRPFRNRSAATGQTRPGLNSPAMWRR